MAAGNFSARSKVKNQKIIKNGEKRSGFQKEDTYAEDHNEISPCEIQTSKGNFGVGILSAEY